ncbi:MAG: helicase associated domain-containing protein, partial [Chthoniobacterales bacterium]
ADNPTLGFWVVNQRTSMRTGKLSPEQIRLLDDAGFIWSARSEQSRR